MGMRLFVGSVERNGPEVSDGTATSRRVMTTTELKISEEPLADRVLLQVRSGKLDEARLLPAAEKRVGRRVRACRVPDDVPVVQVQVGPDPRPGSGRVLAALGGLCVTDHPACRFRVTCFSRRAGSSIFVSSAR